MKVTARIVSPIFLVMALTAGIFAQEPVASPSPVKRDRVAVASETQEKEGEKAIKKEGESTPEAVPVDTPKPETGVSDEEAAIRPVYDNYMKEYLLGPEDVISVEVFGQPNYSKAGIVVPPTAVISYPLIPGGIFVSGKSTEQIGKEIAKKLDEYIIDPQVTVTLEKVGSARFAILGRVGAPGVRLMTRRYNLYDAIIESGGIAQGGDKKRVMLVRRGTSGYSRTVYNLDELITGKKEMPYLEPGDQVVVPEKKWSLDKILETVGKLSAARILFGSPF